MNRNYKYFYCLRDKRTGNQASRIGTSYPDLLHECARHYEVVCIAVLGKQVMIPPNFHWNDKYLTTAEKAKFNVKG